MAIEDSIVLADELSRSNDPETAFAAYHARRVERCRYIVESSRAICNGQIGKGPHMDQQTATVGMFDVVSKPI